MAAATEGGVVAATEGGVVVFIGPPARFLPDDTSSRVHERLWPISCVDLGLL